MQGRGRKKGFTLVELIVVIAIIGVLAAIVVPTTLHFVNDAKIEQAQVNGKLIIKTIETNVHNIAWGSFPGMGEEGSGLQKGVLNGAAVAAILQAYMSGAEEGTQVKIAANATATAYVLSVISPQEIDGARIVTEKVFGAEAEVAFVPCTVIYNGSSWNVA